MNRNSIRAKLIAKNGKLVDCPLCGQNLGTRCHEIVYCQTEGRQKYTDDSIYMVPENCILLCDTCNTRIGGGQAYVEELLVWKMSDPNWPPAKVIPALQQIAGQLKNPGQFMPRSVTVNEVNYQIL